MRLSIHDLRFTVYYDRMIEVVNRQRRFSVDTEKWRAFGEKALQEIGTESHGAIIAFVSDRMMRELNKEFRGRDATTDVLSFPAGRFEVASIVEEDDLGDVVVSLERAAAQAVEHKMEFEDEIAQLILHGLLHLCGHDHETDNGEMNRLELKLRRRLSL
jgi:probable rRNA maturation factor